MRKSIRKYISMLLIACMLVSISYTNVLASGEAEDNITIDGYKIKVLSDNEEKAEVSTTVGGIEYTLVFDKEEEEYDLYSKEYPTTILGMGIGSPDEEHYSIEVEDTTDDCIVADIVPDSGSKEIIHIDETEVEAQTTAILGYGLGALVTALLEALLLTTATVMVAGTVYYAASSIAKTLKRKQPNVHYYKAYLKAGDNVYIGPKINSKSSAAKILASGQNVFAISSGYAYDACKSASPIKKVSSRQKHSGGGKSYYHYHPMIKAKQQSHAHCWYI